MGIIRSLSSDQLNQFEQDKKITLEGKTFIDDEILIFREAKENTETVSNSFISIDIDPTLTDELIQEGIAREVINRIQKQERI